ncbi:MAG: esterase FrsA, partial [Defluviitaleaceae bacterium]|nr:esterase FrsA [Defluviitaleaceae bacterium]
MFKKYIILFVLLIADIALYFYRYAYGFWLEVVFAGLVWLSAVAAIRRIAEYINRRKFKAWIKRLIITALDIVEIFALLAAFIYCYQDAALFHPNDDPASREYILSQADFTEITVNDGKTAYTGYMKRTGGDVPSPLIIMFTGNAQNAAQAMASIDYAGAWGSFLGCDMLIMDYPGYGLNRGAPSSVSICREALLTYDYAGGLPYVDASRIIIGGFSIGTGPAVYLAANRPAAGLFLLAPYASGYDLY